MNESAGIVYFMADNGMYQFNGSKVSKVGQDVEAEPTLLQRIYEALSVFAIVAFFLAVSLFFALLTAAMTGIKYGVVLGFLGSVLK